MKRFLKITKWTAISLVTAIILSVLFLRISRFSDKMLYQVHGTGYTHFESELNYEQFFFDVDTDVQLHGVLFKPDTLDPLGTIFHYPGQAMTLMSQAQDFYKRLLNQGFQIFSFERRETEKSTGKATHSLTLKNDALFVFDTVTKMDNVKDKPVIIWGQSLGGAFATVNASERQDKVSGLVLEGTFSSFPDIGKVYAGELNLENFKWIVPLIMNNDFPAEKEIKELTTPTLIIHSESDSFVPYELGRKLYEASNKDHTKFWKITGEHIMGMMDYEEEYIEHFKRMIE